VLFARRLRRVACALGAFAVTALASSLLLFGPHAELVMKAAGIPKNASGIGGFINGAHALIKPALVMVAAVAPLAVIASGSFPHSAGRADHCA